jgi:hypothetical protein
MNMAKNTRCFPNCRHPMVLVSACAQVTAADDGVKRSKTSQPVPAFSDADGTDTTFKADIGSYEGAQFSNGNNRAGKPEKWEKAC